MAGINKIEELFIFILKKSTEARLNNSNFDGIRFWKGIKKPLKMYDSFKMAWNESAFDDDKLLINEHDDEGKLIELYHFMRQQARIPIEDEDGCTLRKIMQLALNIGQFIGSNNNNCDLVIGKCHYLSDKQSIFDFFSLDELLRFSKSELYSDYSFDIVSNEIYKYVNKFILEETNKNV